MNPVVADILKQFKASEKEVLVIVGPTASGKSGLAIQIAKACDGEVVSADSRQVYQGMNIGTGKVTKEEMQGVPHHLLDVAKPSDTYTVSDYKNDAERAIEDMLTRGKTPIVAGGTGLYIDAIVFNMTFAPKVDPMVRATLEQRLETEGHDALYQELVTVDPEQAQKIGRANPRYTIRALEVWHATGKPKSELATKQPGRFSCFIVAISTDRSAHNTVINRRHEAMFTSVPSIIDETRSLLSSGVSPSAESMTSIGYHEVMEYLNQNITKDKAIEKTKIAARKYAKRQMTWFRRLQRFHPIYWVTLSE